MKRNATVKINRNSAQIIYFKKSMHLAHEY